MSKKFFLVLGLLWAIISLGCMASASISRPAIHKEPGFVISYKVDPENAGMAKVFLDGHDLQANTTYTLVINNRNESITTDEKGKFEKIISTPWDARIAIELHSSTGVKVDSQVRKITK